MKGQRKPSCGVDGCSGKGHVDGITSTHRIYKNCPFVRREENMSSGKVFFQNFSNHSYKF